MIKVSDNEEIMERTLKPAFAAFISETARKYIGTHPIGPDYENRYEDFRHLGDVFVHYIPSKLSKVFVDLPPYIASESRRGLRNKWVPDSDVIRSYIDSVLQHPANPTSKKLVFLESRKDLWYEFDDTDREHELLEKLASEEGICTDTYKLEYSVEIEIKDGLGNAKLVGEYENGKWRFHENILDDKLKNSLIPGQNSDLERLRGVLFWALAEQLYPAFVSVELSAPGNINTAQDSFQGCKSRWYTKITETTPYRTKVELFVAGEVCNKVRRHLILGHSQYSLSGRLPLEEIMKHHRFNQNPPLY